MQHDRLDISEFEWEADKNEAHCARHGITPLLVEVIKNGNPKFFPNKVGLTGTHMMMGPDDTGRFWTIIILPTARKGTWRAITGWPSTNREVTLYANS